MCPTYMPLPPSLGNESILTGKIPRDTPSFLLMFHYSVRLHHHLHPLGSPQLCAVSVVLLSQVIALGLQLEQGQPHQIRNFWKP